MSRESIFSLHDEALRRQRRGERIIDGTAGVLLDDAGRLAVLRAGVAEVIGAVASQRPTTVLVDATYAAFTPRGWRPPYRALARLAESAQSQALWFALCALSGNQISARVDLAADCLNERDDL